MTTAKSIAAAIVSELQKQYDHDDNKGDIGWIDSDRGNHNVVLDGRFDLEKVAQGLIDQSKKPSTWRCFHCDQVFHTDDAARAHFGDHEGRTPACQIKASEGGLVRALREAEGEAERAWSIVHSEGADGLQAWRGAMSRNDQAVRSAEEAGYERGLADHHATVLVLRDLIAMVDQMDKPPSSGGGVLPLDKAKVMHAAREAAK